MFSVGGVGRGSEMMGGGLRTGRWGDDSLYEIGMHEGVEHRVQMIGDV